MQDGRASPHEIATQLFWRSKLLMHTLLTSVGRARRICCNATALPLAALTLALPVVAAQSTSTGNSAVTVSVFDRTRMDAWQWFAAPPANSSYTYVQTLQRFGISQRLH